MKDKILNEVGEQLRAEFETDYADGGCSCHINPPCNYCMHQGNPANLEDTPEAWQEIESVEEPVVPAIEMTPVKSSNIGSIGYCSDTKTLAVKFNHGGTYHFKGVTPEKYQEFASAESVGRHFLSEIKGKFEAEKI